MKRADTSSVVSDCYDFAILDLFGDISNIWAALNAYPLGG